MDTNVSPVRARKIELDDLRPASTGLPSRDSGTAACPVDDSAGLWAALASDARSIVMVFDPLGVVVYANSAAALELGVPLNELVGRTILDLTPPEFGQERLGTISGVARGTHPVVVDGFVNGCFRRTTYRSVRGIRGETLVLAVSNAGPIGHDLGPVSPDVPLVRARVDDLGNLRSLTPRELDILRLIGEGLSTADIAETLRRSVKTIEWHRVSIGSKLRATNRVELARIAVFAGLSRLEPQRVGTEN